MPSGVTEDRHEMRLLHLGADACRSLLNMPDNGLPVPHVGMGRGRVARLNAGTTSRRGRLQIVAERTGRDAFNTRYSDYPARACTPAWYKPLETQAPSVGWLSAAKVLTSAPITRSPLHRGAAHGRHRFAA